MSLIIAASAFLLAIQGPASAAEVSPAAKKLIPAAQAEGTLNLAWVRSVFEGARSYKLFEKGFNSHYGTRIKISHTSGLDLPPSARKHAEELGAGEKSYQDIVLGGTGQAKFLFDKKVTQPVDWGALAPHISKKVLKGIVAPDNSLITVIIHLPGILYSTKKISKADAPRKLTDLLDPRWKGKVAATPFAAIFGVLPYHSAWTKEKVIDFTHKLSANLGGMMGCGAHDRITSGEFWMFAINCNDGKVTNWQAMGIPVERVVPEDMVMVVHWYMGVPKNAVNPNAAKLFVAWLLTPEGQKALFSEQGSDLHVLKGSRTVKRIAAVARKAGHPIVDISIDRALNLEHPKLQRQAGKILRASRKGKGKRGGKGGKR